MTQGKTTTLGSMQQASLTQRAHIPITLPYIRIQHPKENTDVREDA